MKKKILLSMLVVVNLTVLSLGSFVLATHSFSDVPTDAYFHSAVTYIKDRGVTQGCEPGKFCPGQAVVRQDMAVFLKNMAEATKPVYVQTTGGLGSLDVDPGPVVCETAPYTPPFPQRAYVTTWVSGLAAGDMSFVARGLHTTSGGSTYINNDSTVARGSSVSGQWGSATQLYTVDLSPGQPYQFAVATGRVAGFGTADFTDHRCEVVAQISNR